MKIIISKGNVQQRGLCSKNIAVKEREIHITILVVRALKGKSWSSPILASLPSIFLDQRA